MTGHPLLPLTEAEAAYIAGLVDSRGSISIMRRTMARPGSHAPTYAPHILIWHLEPDLLAWLRRTTGAGTVVTRSLSSPGESGVHRVAYWRIASNLARLLALRILPYARVKRAHLELVVEFQGIKDEWNRQRHVKGIR